MLILYSNITEATISNKNGTSVSDASINGRVHVDISGAAKRASNFWINKGDTEWWTKLYGKYDGQTGKIISGEIVWHQETWNGDWFFQVKLTKEMIDLPVAVLYVEEEDVSQNESNHILITSVDTIDNNNNIPQGDAHNGHISSDDGASIDNVSNAAFNFDFDFDFDFDAADLNLSPHFGIARSVNSVNNPRMSNIFESNNDGNVSSNATSSNDYDSDLNINSNNNNMQINPIPASDSFYNQYGINENVCP